MLHLWGEFSLLKKAPDGEKWLEPVAPERAAALASSRASHRSNRLGRWSPKGTTGHDGTCARARIWRGDLSNIEDHTNQHGKQTTKNWQIPPLGPWELLIRAQSRLFLNPKKLQIDIPWPSKWLSEFTWLPPSLGYWMGKTMASGGIDDEQRDFRKKMLCSSISQKEVVGLAENEATIFGHCQAIFRHRQVADPSQQPAFPPGPKVLKGVGSGKLRPTRPKSGAENHKFQDLQSDPFEMVKWPRIWGFSWPWIDAWKGHFEDPASSKIARGWFCRLIQIENGLFMTILNRLRQPMFIIIHRGWHRPMVHWRTWCVSITAEVGLFARETLRNLRKTPMSDTQQKKTWSIPPISLIYGDFGDV